MMCMSSSRSSTMRTGRRRCHAGTAIAAFTNAGRDSLPPNPPPMRFVCTTTLCMGMPSTPCTVTWCFAGACSLADSRHHALDAEAFESYATDRASRTECRHRSTRDNQLASPQGMHRSSSQLINVLQALNSRKL